MTRQASVRYRIGNLHDALPEALQRLGDIRLAALSRNRKRCVRPVPHDRRERLEHLVRGLDSTDGSRIIVHACRMLSILTTLVKPIVPRGRRRLFRPWMRTEARAIADKVNAEEQALANKLATNDFPHTPRLSS